MFCCVLCSVNTAHQGHVAADLAVDLAVDAGAGATGGGISDAVASLCAMGFGRAQAEEELAAHSGDVEAAANSLLGLMPSKPAPLKVRSGPIQGYM